MANLLRRRIAQRIVNVLKNDVGKETSERIASNIRINIGSMTAPQFCFSWRKGLELNLITEKEVNDHVLNILSPKGYMSADGIIKVENSGDKYQHVLFTVDRNVFIKEVLLEAFHHSKSMSAVSPLLNSYKSQRVIVEYSSPNIAKPFHVGHLRSTIIGNVIANLNSYLGNHVTRINYLGDWGTQYGILSAGYDKFGSDDELNKNPMEHLFNVYVASNELEKSSPDFLNHAKAVFSLMEGGDEEQMKRWTFLREISITEFNKMYSRLGVHFDVIQGESSYHKKASEIVKSLCEQKVATIDKDCAVRITVDWPNQGTRSLTLAKKDGGTLYLSRDVAAAIDRKTVFDFDRAVYVVDKSQSDHFIALKALLKKMGHHWADSLFHLQFGRIQGMSTRKGQVVFLHELLDQAKKLAHQMIKECENTNPEVNPEQTAEVLGISAVLINDLRLKTINDYMFDWERALHYKGDSGMELQYCHARLCSIESVFGKLINTNFDPNTLYEPEALHLALQISRFDEALHETFWNSQPYFLVMYLFRLNLYISKAYRELSLAGTPRRIAEARYFLLHTARLVLKQGMEILGLKPLEKM